MFKIKLSVIIYITIEIGDSDMGRKNKKNIKLSTIKLTEEESKISSTKAILTILLCVMWPLTLIILIPNIKNMIPDMLFYLLIFISLINVYLSVWYNKVKVDNVKYQAYLSQNKIGKVERFASLILIFEVGLVILFLLTLKKIK